MYSEKRIITTFYDFRYQDTGPCLYNFYIMFVAWIYRSKYNYNLYACKVFLWHTKVTKFWSCYYWPGRWWRWSRVQWQWLRWSRCTKEKAPPVCRQLRSTCWWQWQLQPVCWLLSSLSWEQHNQCKIHNQIIHLCTQYKLLRQILFGLFVGFFLVARNGKDELMGHVHKLFIDRDIYTPHSFFFLQWTK